MSDVYQSPTHSKWDCKYHVVFVAKRRRKAMFGPVGNWARSFTRWPGNRSARFWKDTSCRTTCTYCIAIPPKHPVALAGFLKRKSAIASARRCGKSAILAASFLARGYAVSTVGFELEQVRQYIREQEGEDRVVGQF
jgi:putative transposase